MCLLLGDFSSSFVGIVLLDDFIFVCVGLMLADRGHADAIVLLFQNGADASKENKEGKGYQ